MSSAQLETEADCSATAAPDPTPTHLTPSELGTKQYWEHAYTTELDNHTTSHSTDEGTIWFSTSRAEQKILRYLADQHEQLFLFKDFSTDAGQPSSFLDLGTGNGHFLCELRRRGWRGRAVGVDYSAKSVALARRVAEARARGVRGRKGGRMEVEREGGDGQEEKGLDDGGEEEEEEEEEEESEEDGEGEDGEEAGEDVMSEPLSFVEYDIINSAPEELEGMPEGGFDVVLDKGTFDAVSLSGEEGADGRRVCEGYAARVLPLVSLNGLLIVTSCNWTEEELRHWFERDGMRKGSFACVDRIPYPSFTFGGQKGSSVVTLVFRKVARK